ncbi:MAG: putative phosphoribosyl transferase [Elusimicrobia bacterium]|nr:putative phosphoribosyl transferase [Elusimicrobiota bacterium]
MKTISEKTEIQIPIGKANLLGDLVVPKSPQGVVLFAHGSGSSRHSPRNQFVAQLLNQAGFATLLMDLLTEEEEEEDRWRGHLRFDVKMLAKRLIPATDWLNRHPQTRDLQVGYFGASTGSAAALIAAPERTGLVKAIVSRGGRPDMADEALPRILVPTLLIVGGLDTPVIELNREAFEKMTIKEKQLEIVAGATHLFEEPGTLKEVARLATQWFDRYLGSSRVIPSR